jgi:hypothetical protein
MILLAMILCMVVLLATTVKGFAGVPTEEEKVEALRLGYILNGFSMTRHPSEGSIDLTNRMHVPPPPGVIRTIPITPTEKKKAK